MVVLICLLFFTSTYALDPPKFVHPAETADLDCAKFFEQTVVTGAGASGNNRNSDLAEYRRNRITYPDTENWDSFRMDCRSLFARTYFQRGDLYPEEREFPIAIARTVYKDYRMIEMELAANYAPQNFYCFALDANVSPTFSARMKALAACMPNILLTKHQFAMDSAGRNVSQSNHECMTLLSQPKYNWKYLVITENHDVSLKTNQELIQIFKWLNGSNDMLLTLAPDGHLELNENLSLEKLRLFKNGTRNRSKLSALSSRLALARAFSTVVLSREAVDFFVNELDVSTLLNTIEESYPNADEILMGTLDTNELIGMPGGFTQRCLTQKPPDYFVSRYSIVNGSYCASGIWADAVCILGMEHLAEVIYVPHLFANKFRPDKDFGAIACFHEYMHNRTHLERGTLRLNSRLYNDAPHVRYNRERLAAGENFDPKKFNCFSHSHSNTETSVMLIGIAVFCLMFRSLA
ncbi:N-acetyllactosaminide beta-1,6-N-acetylglucosaminyl-transferase [Aphelenchoides besseyi]|nr:N-acetyllactosaminide beta-1,6-N-acetylglucosaminyl-transferase [Aphelenchoides besseyi]